MAGKAVNGTSDDGERTGSVTRSVRGHGKKGSAASASVNGSGKSRSRYAKKAAAPSPIVTQEMIEAERALLLAEKQAQLEEVLDRHDDLIRECFHMEHFRLMASFNPVESKQDNSPVFREYKSKYDLVQHAAPIAGPSRQTRRAHNERQKALTATPSISAPPALSTSKKQKKKLKPKAPNTAAIWDILSAAREQARGRGKGKGKEKELEPEPEPKSESESTPTPESTRPPESEPPPESASAPESTQVPKTLPELERGLTPKTPPEPEQPPAPEITPEFALEPESKLLESQAVSDDLPTTELDHAEEVLEESISIVATPRNGRRPSPFTTESGAEEVPEESISILATRRNGKRPASALESTTQVAKRHKADRKVVFDDKEQPCPPVEESISVGLARRSGRLKDIAVVQPPLAKKSRSAPAFRPSEIPPPQTPQETKVAPTSLTPTYNVKRIKLIVRRPPYQVTNPLQRPIPPKFNNSLYGFLSSYNILDDKEVSVQKINKLALAEAAVHERVEKFRKDGRFIPGTDALFGTKPEKLVYITPKRVSGDAWDDVVEAVIAYGKSRSKKSSGRAVAGQVANKIQGYWDGQEARKDKARVQEERRLRALAKSTIRQVIGEWKKAVFHIREQERMKLEAEELKRGHAHLDAILHQSGHILETQQGDLARGEMLASRSRSSSVSDRFRDWGSDEEEEEEEADDGQEEQGEEEEEEEKGPEPVLEGEEDVVMGGSDDEAQSSMLLPSQKVTRTLTPSSTTSGPPEEEDASTGQLLPDEQHRTTPSDDESSIASLDDLMIPDPESSPRQIHSNLVLNLTDYPDSDSSPSTPRPLPSEEGGEMLDEPELPRATSVSSSRRTPTSFVAETPADEPDVPMNKPDVEIPSPSSPGVGPSVALDNQDQDVETLDRNEPLPFAGEEIPDLQPEAKAEIFEEIQEDELDAEAPELQIPAYLKPYAVAPVDWDPSAKILPPLLLRGTLRPYQQSGLEWLVSLHTRNHNGILADEMGLGKTIQTIALLAHLACDRGIWGPHLIIVPTSVLLNWEMEFKKFLPGFRILSYHGSTKRRKELRQGWNDKSHFNVCITSYTLASKDAHIFKRKAWYYMILDEAHMIKNFKSQRWNILLMFRSFRRLLLTGTPLQNNLTELWALLQFLMSGSNFANVKEFALWFSAPLEAAIERGGALDADTTERILKLHTVLRPYLLRRMKRDVEKELPSKYEHLLLCPLSKRQRFLYDEFMSRAQTRESLQSGVYQKIANILMQLRKVCNHPDLFEVRPIVTSFAMPRSAIADFEIKELLIRKRLLANDDDENINLDSLGFRFIDRQDEPLLTALETKRLDATSHLPHFLDTPGEPPPKDTRTIAGFRRYSEYLQRANTIARWSQIGHLNRLRCNQFPIYGQECITTVQKMCRPIIPLSDLDVRFNHLDTVYSVNAAVKSYVSRGQEMAGLIERFAFVTPPVVALDMPQIVLSGHEELLVSQPPSFDDLLHHASVKLQIAFPHPSLLQYDCGKLQELANLLRDKKAGGHRVLIFTQMTKILDILEIFLNFHGYLYLRLDGATKIEDRQYITERFNADPRVFCFIASSRSGGVGINLTGADTVVFYDSDFNPQMDRQCEDRAHRIGQIRDVHIYRFVSQHTVEEAMLRKANQKRSLDDIVIQKGEFDWRSLFNDEGALTAALGDFEDAEDAHAAAVAAKEENAMEGADEEDFADTADAAPPVPAPDTATVSPPENEPNQDGTVNAEGEEDQEEEEEGGTVVDYLLTFAQRDWEFFKEWRL